MLKKAKKISKFFFIFLSIALGLLILSQPASTNSPVVHLIELNDDIINPVTAGYIAEAIDRAYEQNAQCLIIRMDTPGGLLNSTRSIVKKMLDSKVPIIVYIAPAGSRAGSAGVFITYASHLAAMAPSTNIGAAHPVEMGEQPNPSDKSSNEWQDLHELVKELKKQNATDEDTKSKSSKDKKAEEAKPETPAAPAEEKIEPDQDPMGSKILNDTVAFIKSIATERNRNVEWAIKSVTKSDSITAHEALEMKVVEILAKNEIDLLTQLHGRVVKIGDKEITLDTKEASIEEIPMDARQKFFNVLANPQVAYFLLILGFYGLLYEITHPGIAFPGILGGIFLVLALYSLQTLSPNYAGLALMAFGILLMILEAFLPGFGLFLISGAVSMILGSLLLFKNVDPVMRVSFSTILTFVLTSAGFTFFIMRSALRSYRSKKQTGQEGMIGEIGEVDKDIAPNQKGKVWVHGELWNAESDEVLKKGDPVVVTHVIGLTVKVKHK